MGSCGGELARIRRAETLDDHLARFQALCV